MDTAFSYEEPFTCEETEYVVSFQATPTDDGLNMQTFLDSDLKEEDIYEGDADKLRFVDFSYLGQNLFHTD